MQRRSSLICKSIILFVTLDMTGNMFIGLKSPQLTQRFVMSMSTVTKSFRCSEALPSCLY